MRPTEQSTPWETPCPRRVATLVRGPVRSPAATLRIALPDRRWNRSDFDLVVKSHALSDEELAEHFPERRRAEVRRLREVLHRYDTTYPHESPDDSMAAHLASLDGELVCATCGEAY